MIEAILVFAALTLLAGIVIVFNPEAIFGFLRGNLDQPALQVMAVVVRLILGVLLLTQAGLSKFPLIIELLGWLSIVAAVILAVVGRKNFKRLMGWAMNSMMPYARIGGLFAAAFGAFLIYAFV